LRGIGYDAPGGRSILNNVTIDVRRGETLALVGRNGAGKSTLAAAIAGLIEPNRGDRRRLDGRVDVAYAFQNPEHQFVADTARAELAIRLRPDRRAREADRSDSRIPLLLDRLGLAHLADRHPFSLSQGEKRRLAILAAATGHDADLMVLDEPSHGLDAAGIEAMIALVSALRTPRRAIVLVSHDMDLVWRLADRVAVMSDGTIAADAPVDTVFADAAMLESAGLGLPSYLPPPGLRDGHQ
jgi:energy-coupling factor transport system ATP-binding protein